MKLLSLVIAVALLTGCDRKPFVEHKLKFEKQSDGCNTVSPEFKMTSNFGGERYEFQKCLPADFTKEQMTTLRQGDTVMVSFKKPDASQAKAVFSITLDIDSYPKYNKITIDGETFAIIPSN
ncbi:MAG TPA: hypothetical protein VIZ28_14485 [Chitinophagaceae bacterium]